MNNQITKEQMDELMVQTDDAFMRHTPDYPEGAWMQIGNFLLKEGWTLEETVVIMKSKYMRWASDDADDHRPNLLTFMGFYRKNETGIVRMFKNELGHVPSKKILLQVEIAEQRSLITGLNEQMVKLVNEKQQINNLIEKLEEDLRDNC